jgi:formate hydrogenlyase transcriptional activator
MTIKDNKRLYASVLVWISGFCGLYITAVYSFPLFHSLAEMSSTAVAVAIFMLVWNARRSLDNTYLLFIGVAYLFIGCLELIHVLAFKGMEVFSGHDENLSIQLWVAARYIESLSLLIAPLLVGRKLDLRFVFTGYALVFSILLGTIFLWEVFPACYVPGIGLTTFKTASEYAISAFLIASIAILVKNRENFDPEMVRLLVASIALSFVSEFFFSSFEHTYGFLSLCGHFLRLLAFYFIYKAIIELGTAKPFNMLFKNLVESERSLKKSHDELELRVEERTADLTKTCEQLSRQIEERTRAEEALQKSELKYRILADHNYDWEWWRDQQGNSIYVSPSCEKISQHTPGEFAADPDLISKILHPEDRPSFSKHLSEIEDQGLSGEIEFRIIRPDGSVRWIAHACQPVFDENGKLLGRRGSNRDITQRKEAERSLNESEVRYRSLVDCMNEGFAIGDEKGTFVYANNKLCEMLGCAYEKVVGRPAQNWLSEAGRQILSEQMIEREKGGRKPYEIEWKRGDGSTRHALVSPTPLFGENGRFKGSSAVITDITELKKAEESLRRALSENQKLRERLEAENIYFRQESETRHQFGNIIGQSNALKHVLYRAEQVAATNATVLVLGETGAGKELIAAAIHQMSSRKDMPLIVVNCAALPPHLIESELFGREKGAFTGSDARQAGRFEIADGSTLCLDEIGELPMEVQAKLLRVVQNNEFERLGSPRTIRVNVRIIATTNRNLEEEVHKGRFRQDLYYRLNVYPLTVPPLRQRRDDIPFLVQFFLEQYARGLGKEFTSIQNEAMKMLQEYDWPGNVRELRNVIERAVILCPGPVFQLFDRLENRACSNFSAGLRTMEETEREQILRTLGETRWRINGATGASAILGLHPSTLRARMHKLGIRRPEANN